MELKDLKLINPTHLELISDGQGEFPDSYKLTLKGIELINSYLSDIIIENQGLKLNQDRAIEFVDWVDSWGFIKDGEKWRYWYNGIVYYTTEELFTEFLNDINGDKEKDN